LKLTGIDVIELIFDCILGFVIRIRDATVMSAGRALQLCSAAFWQQLYT